MDDMTCYQQLLEDIENALDRFSKCRVIPTPEGPSLEPGPDPSLVQREYSAFRALEAGEGVPIAYRDDQPEITKKTLYTAKCKLCNEKFEGATLNDAFNKLRGHVLRLHPNERIL